MPTRRRDGPRATYNSFAPDERSRARFAADNERAFRRRVPQPRSSSSAARTSFSPQTPDRRES